MYEFIVDYFSSGLIHIHNVQYDERIILPMSGPVV